MEKETVAPVTVSIEDENLDANASDMVKLDQIKETEVEKTTENAMETIENGHFTSENEDEENLMPRPIYQKTVESLDKPFKSSVKSLHSQKVKGVNCRTILWYVAFVGFMVNYIFRINVNIAIVKMVTLPKAASSTNTHTSECFQEISIPSNVTSTSQTDDVLIDSSTKFAWNELQQSHVLGSFYWLHWALQIAGGALAPKYGSKAIFGLSNFLSCFLCFFIPMAAKMHVNVLIVLRIIQGMIAGMAWPSMHHLAGVWIPPNERSKFMTAYLGSSVTIAVFYPIFGFILSVWSWESVFYVSGILGSIWYAFWLYFVYDSPDSHPRIDPVEREYIKQSLSGSVHTGKRKVPWSAILTSIPVWSNIIGQFGGIWGLFTMMTQAPTYFHVIHGWSVQMTGILSGVPHLVRMIFAYFFSIYSDSLLSKDSWSRTNVRKFAGFISIIVNGLFVVGLAFSGCSSTTAVVFLILATAVYGAVTAGPIAGVIDMSPNFSGIILGLNGLVSVTPGFISPFIVGKLTYENQSTQQWQYIFLICAIILFVSGSIYILFSDSTLQSWNQPKITSKIINNNNNSSNNNETKNDIQNDHKM